MGSGLFPAFCQSPPKVDVTRGRGRQSISRLSSFLRSFQSTPPRRGRPPWSLSAPYSYTYSSRRDFTAETERGKRSLRKNKRRLNTKAQRSEGKEMRGKSLSLSLSLSKDRELRNPFCLALSLALSYSYPYPYPYSSLTHSHFRPSDMIFFEMNKINRAFLRWGPGERTKWVRIFCCSRGNTSH